MNERELKLKLIESRDVSQGLILTKQDLSLRKYATKIIYNKILSGDIPMECNSIPFNEFIKTTEYKELECFFNTDTERWEYLDGEEAMQDMELFGLFDSAEIIRLSTNYLLHLKFPELRCNDKFEVDGSNWDKVFKIEQKKEEDEPVVIEDETMISGLDFDGSEKRKKQKTLRDKIYSNFLLSFNLTRSSDNIVVRNKAISEIIKQLGGDERMCMDLIYYVEKISKNGGWYNNIRSIYSLVRNIPLFLKNRK